MGSSGGQKQMFKYPRGNRDLTRPRLQDNAGRLETLTHRVYYVRLHGSVIERTRRT